MHIPQKLAALQIVVLTAPIFMRGGVAIQDALWAGGIKYVVMLMGRLTETVRADNLLELAQRGQQQSFVGGGDIPLVMLQMFAVAPPLPLPPARRRRPAARRQFRQRYRLLARVVTQAKTPGAHRM